MDRKYLLKTLTEIEEQNQTEIDNFNLNALINNTNDLMWSIDNEFRLMTFNEPFLRYIEYTFQKRFVKGDYILSCCSSEKLLKEFEKYYKRAMTGQSFMTIINQVIDTTEHWREISFHPIHRDNQIVGTACFSRNITAKKKAEEERIKMIEDIVQRNKELEQFSHIISHKLRKHVANILGLADLIECSELSITEEKKMVIDLSNSAKCLDKVIKDLHYILDLGLNPKKNQ